MQFRLEAKQKYKEFYERIHKNGTVNINQILCSQARLNKAVKEYEAAEKKNEKFFDITPFLKNGVIVYNTCSDVGYVDLDFSVENLTEKNFDLWLSIYHEKEQVWACTFKIKSQKRFYYGLKDYKNVELTDIERGLGPEGEMDPERLKSICGDWVTVAMNVFLRINWLMSHPEFKSVAKIPLKHDALPLGRSSDSNIKNVTKKVQPQRMIDLNKIKIYLRDADAENKIRRKISSKKKQRLVDCWTVRGHYRHYKSGKVVYIEPYEKGKMRNRNAGVRQSKTYIV